MVTAYSRRAHVHRPETCRHIPAGTERLEALYRARDAVPPQALAWRDQRIFVRKTNQLHSAPKEFPGPQHLLMSAAARAARNQEVGDGAAAGSDDDVRCDNDGFGCRRG